MGQGDRYIKFKNLLRINNSKNLNIKIPGPPSNNN
jgi:hypothetical protein